MSLKETKNKINCPNNLQIKENGFSQKDNQKQEIEIESYNDTSEEITSNDIIQDNKIKNKEGDTNGEESKNRDKKKGKKEKCKYDKESNEENKKKKQKKR